MLWQYSEACCTVHAQGNTVKYPYLWRKTCMGSGTFSVAPENSSPAHFRNRNNCTCHGLHVWRQKCAALSVVPPPAGHQLVVTWHIWLVQKTLEWCSVSTEGTEHVPSACTQVSGQCVGSYACGLISSRLLKSGPKLHSARMLTTQWPTNAVQVSTIKTKSMKCSACATY